MAVLKPCISVVTTRATTSGCHKMLLLRATHGHQVCRHCCYLSTCKSLCSAFLGCQRGCLFLSRLEHGHQHHSLGRHVHVLGQVLLDVPSQKLPAPPQSEPWSCTVKL